MSEHKRQRRQAAEDFMKSMEQLQSLLQGEADSASGARSEPLPESDLDWDTDLTEEELAKLADSPPHEPE